MATANVFTISPASVASSKRGGAISGCPLCRASAERTTLGVWLYEIGSAVLFLVAFIAFACLAVMVGPAG